MISKISVLAKNEKKISDFHLRGGSDISYRILGDIVIEPNSKIEDKDLQELLKRLYKPIYIPIIAILTCFLIITSSKKINYKKIRNLIFITTFIIIVISEASLRYSVSSEFLFYTYLLFPWFIFITSYLIFFKMIKNV